MQSKYIVSGKGGGEVWDGLDVGLIVLRQSRNILGGDVLHHRSGSGQGGDIGRGGVEEGLPESEAGEGDSEWGLTPGAVRSENLIP